MWIWWSVYIKVEWMSYVPETFLNTSFAWKWDYICVIAYLTAVLLPDVVFSVPNFNMLKLVYVNLYQWFKHLVIDPGSSGFNPKYITNPILSASWLYLARFYTIALTTSSDKIIEMTVFLKVTSECRFKSHSCMILKIQAWITSLGFRKSAIVLFQWVFFRFHSCLVLYCLVIRGWARVSCSTFVLNYILWLRSKMTL